MSTKENLIIGKLVKIAQKQQSTLIKIAQAATGTQADPEVVRYLKSAWQTAALNSGVATAATPDVTFIPSSTNADQVTLGESYTLKGEIPASNRDTFSRNLQNQIKAQKPELDGKVSTIFLDPVKSLGASMNSRKVIEKLFKIAQNQQKIINKLAQEANLAPQHLDPNKAQKQGARALWEGLGPEFTGRVLTNLEEHGDEMWAGFKPGQRTQTNYDAVLNKLQELTNSGTIQRPYKLVAK